MSVQVPLAEIDAPAIFLRLVGSSNPLVRGDVYDVDANGIPKFVNVDYIQLAKIERLTRSRSGWGVDYSDDFESCRNMQHGFAPYPLGDWTDVQIRVPVEGMVTELLPVGGGGMLVAIRSSEPPGFLFDLLGVQLTVPLALYDRVQAGQLPGHHVGRQAWSQNAVEVETPTGRKHLSYFELMTDALFAAYQARRVNTRADLVITSASDTFPPIPRTPSRTGRSWRPPPARHEDRARTRFPGRLPRSQRGHSQYSPYPHPLSRRA